MKRAMAFARRNARELVRDPLTVGFSLGFPLVLLALLTIIQRNIPVSMFEIDRLAPGVAALGADLRGAVFGDAHRPGPRVVADAAAVRVAHAAWGFHRGLSGPHAAAVRGADRRVLCRGSGGGAGSSAETRFCPC